MFPGTRAAFGNVPVDNHPEMPRQAVEGALLVVQLQTGTPMEHARMSCRYRS
jgi:hypothetical protein